MGERDAVAASWLSNASCSDFTYVIPPLVFNLLDGASFNVDKRFPFDLRVVLLGFDDDLVAAGAPNPPPVAAAGRFLPPFFANRGEN